LYMLWKSEPYDRYEWIMELGHSASPDAKRWLVWNVFHGDHRNRQDYFDALAVCFHPLATPEILRTHGNRLHNTGLIKVLEGIPDAALLSVLADDVPRMRDWEEGEQCLQGAAQVLVWRSANPTVLIALRSIEGSAERRLLSAWVLAAYGEADGEARLIEALQQYVDDPNHRGVVHEGHIVEALGRIRSTAALPLLYARLDVRSYPLLVLALERIEPGKWHTALLDLVPDLHEHIREERELLDEGLLNDWDIERTRRSAQEVLATLDIESPEVNALRAHLEGTSE